MTHQIISNIFFQQNVLETKTRYFLTSNLPELATSRWDIGGSIESRWTRGLGTWDGHRIWKWTRAEGEENLFPDRKYISSDIEITGIPSVWIVIVEQSVRASDSRNWSSETVISVRCTSSISICVIALKTQCQCIKNLRPKNSCECGKTTPNEGKFVG